MVAQPDRYAVTITPVQGSPNTYAISGLSSLTTAEGAYQLTVNATGITDTEADPGFGTASTSWTMDLTPPQLVSIQSVTTNPRNTVVMSLDVTFSEPINLSTFTPSSNLDLSLNGGPNLIDSRVQIAYVSGDTYQITGFNWVVGQQGTYTMTVNAAGVQDLAGNVGSGSRARAGSWTPTPPAAASNVSVARRRRKGNNSWLTGTTNSSVTGGWLGETGLLVELFDLTTSQSLGTATVTGTKFLDSHCLGLDRQSRDSDRRNRRGRQRDRQRYFGRRQHHAAGRRQRPGDRATRTGLAGHAHFAGQPNPG